MATGRKSAYTTIIEPNLKNIEKWLSIDNMSINEICEKLGIHRDTFYKYAYREKTELTDIVKKNNESFNEEIEAEYINYAIYGRYVTEEKLTYNYEYLEDGTQIERLVTKEVNKRFIKPDSAQGIFTMKNKCNWADKTEVAYTEQELKPTVIIDDSNKN